MPDRVHECWRLLVWERTFPRPSEAQLWVCPHGVLRRSDCSVIPRGRRLRDVGHRSHPHGEGRGGTGQAMGARGVCRPC